jgi:hypothetical protein
MKKILIFIYISFLLSSCGSAGDAFKLKKKTNADEFLVEKKSPLILPPDYGKLPLPGNGLILIEADEEEEIKDIIIGEKKLPQESNKDGKATSIEKSILEKIN